MRSKLEKGPLLKSSATISSKEITLPTQTRRIFSKEIYCYMYLDSSQTLHTIRKWGGGDWDVKWTHLTADNIPLDE
jgi:hypothetical protein